MEAVLEAAADLAESRGGDRKLCHSSQYDCGQHTSSLCIACRGHWRVLGALRTLTWVTSFLCVHLPISPIIVERKLVPYRFRSPSYVLKQLDCHPRPYRSQSRGWAIRSGQGYHCAQGHFRQPSKDALNAPWQRGRPQSVYTEAP